MVGSAVVRGEAGRPVRVELPRRIELYSLRGARITIEDIVSDLPSAPRLDSGGALLFRFGKTIATTRTDFDGFFLFERVPYGDYRIRLSKETAEVTGLPADLKVKVSVSAAKSIVRLGSIHVEPPPRIASLE